MGKIEPVGNLTNVDVCPLLQPLNQVHGLGERRVAVIRAGLRVASKKLEGSDLLPTTPTQPEGSESAA
jgi:hypothetical protein